MPDSDFKRLVDQARRTDADVTRRLTGDATIPPAGAASAAPLFHVGDLVIDLVRGLNGRVTGAPGIAVTGEPFYSVLLVTGDSVVRKPGELARHRPPALRARG